MLRHLDGSVRARAASRGYRERMSKYVRPEWPVVEFLDESGEPIPYGHRWGMGEVPEEAYSRVSHPERYAPLHAVAEALIRWLTEEYDVTVVDDPAVESDVSFTPPAVRAVRLTPVAPGAAPLTVVLTDYPGVFVHAGALQDHVFPRCGCDACDEDVVSVTEELEWVVAAIVHGEFTESVDVPSPGWVTSGLRWGDRSGTGGVLRDDLPPERLAAAKEALPAGGVWAPWVRRDQPAG